MINYGEALKYQREYCKLSQSELARKTGLKQQNISRWENNEVLPNIDFCVKLADFYGVSLDELVGREDDFGNVVAPMGERNNLSEQENELLKLFRTLSDIRRETLLDTIRAMSAKAGARHA